ncbi:MAG: spermidine synthase [Bacteroidetes bacterium 4572_128]|nr:MAG: spermidine synthase [Bacteroidetes bacterium 4572_128]
MKLRSNILKLSLFATGLSGIVAEYILSTLATYFLGNSVFQWTMIVSIMMFSMGLGSRISKYFHKNLLEKFIIMEFLLSIMVSFSSLIVYFSSSYTSYIGFIIYFMSIVIGILIGMEIPLVIRLNNEFESLRINVASIIEKDYYGSLAGGLFFAFIGLPYLGLTYTPFILGMINFLVALLLFFILYKHLKNKVKFIFNISYILVFTILIVGTFIAKPVILFGEQKKYKDKVIFSKQSVYQKIVITKWKEHFWLYINGNQQLSTLDEVLYHEPLVHPVMQMSKNPCDILVMGGGDGCAVREILKYDMVKNITLIDLDPEMTKIGKENHIFRKLNENAFHNKKVKIFNEDAFNFLEKTQNFYDVIIIDLPDPRTIELGRLYSYEFYKQCYKHLRKNGFVITQAGSPYYATKSFLCIDKTMSKAGFETQKLHNQILTLGEWGWIIGAKNMKKNFLKKTIKNLKFKNIHTKWLNNEAMSLMSSFGKNIYVYEIDTIEINSIHNPVLYNYYLKGNWDLY